MADSDLDLGAPAPDLELLDADQTTVRLSDYLRRGPVVTVFLRHFG